MAKEKFQDVGVKPDIAFDRTADGLVHLVKLVDGEEGSSNLSGTSENPLNVSAEVFPGDSLSMSEFGETRVASPGNRADVEFSYDKQPQLIDDISTGAGSATHQANGRHILLAVGGTAAGDVAGIRYHYWVPYTPGSGQEIDITGTMDFAGIGGGAASVFLRSTVNGSTSLQEIQQSSWIAASSGVHWQYSQIFRFTFQSLRVGRIQFSLVRNGSVVKIAEITNDNIRKTGFWQYPSLPPYWKIFRSGSNTVVEFGYGDELNGIGVRYTFDGLKANATAAAICGTVKSQGGQSLFNLPGFPFATPILAAKTVSTALIPIISVRVAATINSIANREVVIPEGYSLLTDNPIDYVILYRPVLTNPSWVALDAVYSGMEYDITASAVTGGIIVDSDMLSSGNNQIARKEGLLGRTIMSLGSGLPDILTIAAIRGGSTNSAVKSRLKGREIR